MKNNSKDIIANIFFIYLILKNITKTYLNLFIFMVKLTIVK